MMTDTRGPRVKIISIIRKIALIQAGSLACDISTSKERW